MPNDAVTEKSKQYAKYNTCKYVNANYYTYVATSYHCSSKLMISQYKIQLTARNGIKPEQPKLVVIERISQEGCNGSLKQDLCPGKRFQVLS